MRVTYIERLVLKTTMKKENMIYHTESTSANKLIYANLELALDSFKPSDFAITLTFRPQEKQYKGCLQARFNSFQ